MNEQQQDQVPAAAPASEPRRGEPEIEALLADLVRVGRMWAGHGLTVGRLALEHSARTLELTAGALGEISRRVVSDRVD